MLEPVITFFWGILGCVLVLSCKGLKQTLFMNNIEVCGRTLFNGDAAEGDEFIVKSNGWTEETEVAKNSPMECWVVFNFRNRLSIVQINEWWCVEPYPDPTLEIYDNCDGERKYPLVKLNCSEEESHPLQTTGACVTIIHSRQQTTTGYYFSLNILVSKELVIFPVSAMAAVLFSSLVLIMIIIKVVCVVSGYDNRLPKLNLTEEEEKKILEEAILHVRLESPNGLDGEDSCTLLVPTPSSTNVLVTPTEGEGHTSRVFRKHRRRDYGFMGNSIDDDPPPRLKRFPSYKASSLFRK